MFVRRGESLGSVVADVDPSEIEKQQKRSAAAKKAAETRAANAESAAEPEPEEPEAEPEPEEELEVPKHGDLKAVWIEYAVKKGMDRELAEDESTTKQDLIDYTEGE